jgi:hypothetical protein
VVEAADHEADAFDPLDQVVDGFGRPVGHEGSVPGDDVVPPAGDGATERADLDGQAWSWRSTPSWATNSSANRGSVTS